MKTVLLPVKDFQDAKQRLAPALGPQQRAGLARAMLADVLDALSAATEPSRIVVYTASESVDFCGAQVCDEPTCRFPTLAYEELQKIERPVDRFNPVSKSIVGCLHHPARNAHRAGEPFDCL